MLLVPGKAARRRPGTAGRKTQLNFGKKLGIPASAAHMVHAPLSTTNKGPGPLDLDVTKLRPRVIHQERERLYDDVMK